MQVAVGVHRYQLREPRRSLLLRDQPPLNWRALLGDKAKHSVPAPLVEFQLFETGAEQGAGVVLGATKCMFGRDFYARDCILEPTT